MDLSVVIVNWNGGEDILRCLQSLRSAPCAVEMEVIVVDNASTDDSVEQIPHLFPSVRVIQTGTNLGFARAANRGLGAAQGDYVLVIDIDALASVNILNLTKQVLLHRLFTADFQNIVRNQRPIDQRVAGVDVVVSMNTQMLSVGHEVLLFDPRLILDKDRPLASLFFTQ